ncbi:hypothetical protein [uncultured Boseongicola sp.]|jgi:hypothetical protein|uniref:hypothetical protein n=1 Tax=uncultured Boseongicola sp. TaxID=1648499 RepID=UPI00262681D7|nr:hypothetical protein [uncultured Boseongicola sp.]
MWFDDIDIKTDHCRRSETSERTSQTRPEIMRVQRIAKLNERENIAEIAIRATTQKKSTRFSNKLLEKLTFGRVLRQIG